LARDVSFVAEPFEATQSMLQRLALLTWRAAE